MKKNLLSLSTLLFALAGHAQWSGQWTSVQDMSLIRSQHTIFALPDGKVLAAGGWGGAIHLTDSEINDGGSGGGSFQWTSPMGNMASAHTSGAGVVLTNGKALITGGYTGSVNTAVCELYDPTTTDWSATGSLTNGRSDHTATLLQSGKVLVTGGFDGINNLTVCELYDPATNTWSVVPSGLATGRSYHTATLQSNGKVLIAGGYNPNAGFQLSSVEIYDPVMNAITSGPSMNSSRAWHAASLLADGRVLVSGGEHFNGGTPFAYNGMVESEIYDPGTNAWTAAANLPVGVCYNRQFTLKGNKVLMIAGASNTDYNGSFTYAAGTTYVYDVVSNSWTDYPMSIDGRVRLNATQVADSLVLVSGGLTHRETEYFKVEIQTATKPDASANSFFVYPNPASSFVFIEVEGDPIFHAGITLTDITGRRTKPAYETMSPGKFKLDLCAYPMGIYKLDYHTADGFKSRMLLIGS